MGCLGLALALLFAVGVAGFWWLRSRGLTEPVPGQQRCVATAGGHSVAVDPDQAHFASIIAGMSVRRKLVPRAASIALATVYQESGIRNLSYGDRDSLGLFQQRPSQGWGTKKQVMDPYYATGKFYDALVKVKNWETGDINDVAQAVQRSGYPEAYRAHEANARTLASVLTGQTPGGFSCLDRSGTRGNPKAMLKAMEKTFGPLNDRTEDKLVTVEAGSDTLAWAYGHFAVANAKDYGVVSVTVGDQRWQTDDFTLPTWNGATPALTAERLEITLR